MKPSLRSSADMWVGLCVLSPTSSPIILLRRSAWGWIYFRTRMKNPVKTTPAENISAPPPPVSAASPSPPWPAPLETSSSLTAEPSSRSRAPGPSCHIPPSGRTKRKQRSGKSQAAAGCGQWHLCSCLGLLLWFVFSIRFGYLFHHQSLDASPLLIQLFSHLLCFLSLHLSFSLRTQQSVSSVELYIKKKRNKIKATQTQESVGCSPSPAWTSGWALQSAPVWTWFWGCLALPAVPLMLSSWGGPRPLRNARQSVQLGERGKNVFLRLDSINQAEVLGITQTLKWHGEEGQNLRD